MKVDENISLIQITDTHILDDRDQEFYGFNTSKSLEAIIEKINQEETDLVLITGDLVQEPTEAAYQNFLSLTETIDFPCYCLPGNHDNPQLMQKLLSNTHMNYIDSLEFSDWQIIFLNSHKDNTHGGYLKRNELKQLEKILKNNSEKYHLIALHHHPIPIDSPWMDGMMLENANEFNEIIKSKNNIQGIIWGHIHQSFEHFAEGVTYIGSPSTCIQFKPKAKQYEQDDLPPGFRKIDLFANGQIETEVFYLDDFVA